MSIVVCFDIYISLGVIIWHLDISFTIFKSTFICIKFWWKSYRAYKPVWVWFLVLDNILKFGAGGLGAWSQLCPDCIRIVKLLNNGISSSIRNCWGGAVGFDVFSKWVIPIEGSILFFQLQISPIIKLYSWIQLNNHWWRHRFPWELRLKFHLELYWFHW